jgi:hypothetical protein
MVAELAALGNALKRAVRTTELLMAAIERDSDYRFTKLDLYRNTLSQVVMGWIVSITSSPPRQGLRWSRLSRCRISLRLARHGRRSRIGNALMPGSTFNAPKPFLVMSPVWVTVRPR